MNNCTWFALVLAGFLAATAASAVDSRSAVEQSARPASLGGFSGGVWRLDRNADRSLEPAAETAGWGSPGNIPIVGDWNGDGVDDLGVYAGGVWFLDRNGDGQFDPVTEAKGWGVAGWTPMPGDWNGDGITDLGVVAPGSVWFRDLNGDFAFDPATEMLGWGSPGDTPLVADWNGDGRDEIAVFSGGAWFIDFNGDGAFDPATEVKGWGVAGWKPLPGDWNGDGRTDLGVVAPGSVWFRDLNGDFGFDPGSEVMGWGSAGDTPVAADWNGDGKDDPAVLSGAIWFADFNGNGDWEPNEIALGFGQPGDIPVVGRWAAPPAGAIEFFPPPGSQDLHTTRRIILSLTTPVDPSSVHTGTVRLTSGTATITATTAVSPDGLHISLRPASNGLTPDRDYRVAVSGLQSRAGATFPSAEAVFRTGVNGLYERFVGTPPTRFDRPATGAILMNLGAPADPTTFAGAGFVLEDDVQQQYPIVCSLREDWRSLHCPILAPLPVGARLWLRNSDLKSVYGTGFHQSDWFSVSFEPDNGRGPRVVAILPADGSTGVESRTDRAVLFDKPVAAVWPPPDITMSSNGAEVPIQITQWSEYPKRLNITLMQGTFWVPGQTYTINVRNVFDASGRPLEGGPQSATFVAGANGPYTGIGGRQSPARKDAPLNVRVFVGSNAPFNPSTVSTSTVRLEGPNGPVPISVQLDGPNLLFLTPLTPLAPNTRYEYFLDAVFTQTGVLRPATAQFTTGTANDFERPRVTALSIAEGATGMRLLPSIGFKFSESVYVPHPEAIRIETAGGQPVGSYASDYQRYFVSARDLSPNTQYRVVVDGVLDLAGNKVVPFQTTFTTGAGEAGSDGVRPRIVSIDPVRGAAGVSLQPVIRVEFDEPVDLTTLDTVSLQTDSMERDVAISGLDNGRTLRIVPRQPLRPGLLYQLSLHAVTDLAGNESRASSYFTTAAGATDTTGPRILSITPVDGATIPLPGQESTPVEVVFSEAVTERELWNNLYVLVDGQQVSAYPQASDDWTRHVFSVRNYEPHVDAEITVIIDGDLEDLYGNKAGERRVHHLKYRPPPPSAPTQSGVGGTSFRDIRPSRGVRNVSPDAPISLTATGPVSLQSVQDLLRVSQNGRLIDGSLTLRGNDQIVEFRPDQPFEAGAIVRFFLNGLLKGNNPADYGNRVQLDRSFTVAGGSARFGLLSVSPTHSADEIPISARPRIRFSARVDPASITPSTVKFSPAYLGTPYAVRVLSDGATVEIVPSQLLAPGAYYSIELTTGIASASGEPFPGTFTHRFTTGAAVETSPPRVRAVSPPDGLSGVPLNAQIRATMSGDLDTTSVRRENIRVHALGRIWPVDAVMLDYGRPSFSVKTLELLQPNTLYTIQLSGLLDVSGNAAPAKTWSFTTGGDVDFLHPAWRSDINVLSNLAPGSPVVIHFNEPLDPTSLLDWRAYNSVRNQYSTGVWSLSNDGMTGTFTPDQPFAVGTAYQFQNTHIRDLVGNEIRHEPNFSIGLTPDVTGPTVIETSLPNGAVHVTPFARIKFTLDERAHPGTVNASGIRLLRAGSPQPVFAEILDSDYGLQGRELAIGCLCALELATAYTIEIHGVTDLAGNPLSPAYQYSFTTKAAYDFRAPTYASNVSGSGLFRRVAEKIRASEPLDPATVNPQNIYYQVGSEVWPVAVSWDPSTLMIRVTPQLPLPPNSKVKLVISNRVQDLYGNRNSFDSGGEFTTGEAEFDVEPPYVTRVNPPDGATNVRLQPYVAVVYNEAFDPFSGGSPKFRLLGPGGVETASDSLLAPNTTYTIDVPATGTDFADLPFAGAQFSFTTGGGTTSDMTGPTLVSSTPAPGAVDVALSSAIELVFDGPVVPWPPLLRKWGASASDAIPTSWTSGVDPTRVVIRPLQPLLPNTHYSLSFSVTDPAGNFPPAEDLRFFDFYTGNAPATDMTAPTVLSINPPDGSTDVASREILIELSEPIQASTLNAGLKLFYNGAPWSHVSPSYAPGGTTIRLNHYGTLSGATVVTVTVSPELLDLAGNPAEPFVSRFTTAPPTDTPPMTVTGVRPAAGAQGLAPEFAFHLFLSSAIDPTTAQGAVYLSENGVLLAASTTMSAGGYVLSVRPDRPYAAGAEARLFVDLRLLQLEGGGAVGNHIWSARAHVREQLFTVVSGAPASPRPRNTELVIRFSEPLDPATVNADHVALRTNAYPTPVDVPASFSVEDGGKQLRVVPDFLLQLGSSYHVALGAGLRSVSGLELGMERTLGFSTTSEEATLAPMAKISPVDGATEVGVNAVITARFDGPVELATVNRSTVSLTAGNMVIRPSMAEWVGSTSNQTRRLKITPDEPLAASTTYELVLDGVEDLAGNPVPAVSSTFTTAAGPDLVAPRLLSVSPSYAGAPRNSAIILEFDEPIDPLTTEPTVLAPFQTAPILTRIVDPSGRTVTLLPDQPFEAGASVRLRLHGVVQDVSGNPFNNNYSDISVSIGDELALQPLRRTGFSPGPRVQNIPINSKVAVAFDREIRPSSLDPSKIRIEAGGVPIPIRIEVVGQGKTLELSPVGLFDPFTTYTWIVDGLVDIAGNPQGRVYEEWFETGAGPRVTPPAFVSSLPTENSVGFNPGSSWSVRFDAPLHPDGVMASFSPANGAPPAAVVIGDGFVVSVRPDQPFPPGIEATLVLSVSGLSGGRTSVEVKGRMGN